MLLKMVCFIRARHKPEVCKAVSVETYSGKQVLCD